MTVGEFEQKVWELEGIRVVIRAKWGAEVEAFDWVKCSKEDIRLSEFCANRLDSRLGGLEYMIVDGHGSYPNGNTKVLSVRNSYT